MTNSITFVSVCASNAPFLPQTRAVTTHVNSVSPYSRTPRRATITAQSSQNQNQRQIIEYIVRPDGRVEEKVLNVDGQECLEITNEINEKLGEVVSTKLTEDYFKDPQTITEHNINKETW
eukprot:Plantae.Rhodophyta-Palmaria_palmata.ctg21393.p1 GENE.Plantae.Rhodophyta-Palmaria_palmata.ctg21393~~Plantae.Rhodophyta-Palmaria_palmata.ctg21393.p1  ORF type:complete len:120 (-),score=4.93 Plantae.Rhodophyta-Palmaria_palmata.ctg21393:42-401(-)